MQGAYNKINDDTKRSTCNNIIIEVYTIHMDMFDNYIHSREDSDLNNVR